MSSPAQRSSMPRALSPMSVMVWDTHTESFAPHSPDPHSSSSPTSNTHFSPTTSQKRQRHHSNPESILDFDDFLRQTHAGESLPPPPPTPATATPSTKSGGGKNPLKVVLKEVLGGGGNNASQSVPKDAVVYAFGRGGVARTPNKTKPAPTTTSTTSTTSRDPYYAFVPFGPGSPPSPTTYHFPPNSINPYAKPAPKPDPYTSLYGSGDNYYFASRNGRQGTVPSPAPTMSSTNSTSDESVVDNHRRAPPPPLPLKITTTTTTRGRERSKSFTSPTTPPTNNTNTNVGVFVNPEQARLEAKLRAEEYEKGKGKQLGGPVKVVVSPVLGSEDSHSHSRGRSVDVISIDDDAFSLSGFPAPPPIMHFPPRPSAPIPPPPRSRSTSATNNRPTTNMNLRSRLPTMPPPTQPLPPIPTGVSLPPLRPLHKARSLRSIDSGLPLPPVPSRPPPPRPAESNTRTTSSPPYPSGPVRRGSAPAVSPLPPPALDVVSLLSSLSTSNTPVPTMTEEMMLQKALERERQRLEERVRGLMWLVESLEGQKNSPQFQQHDGEQYQIGGQRRYEGSPDRLTSSSSSGTVTDKRSSTSTERAVTYLPYLR